ncbi:MAG: glycoside hydrolase family 43 protein [Eubacteriales bacterium]|nr:glycoside hydrolase family 43 protein [Eubacteriales bacterium]
MKKRLLITGVAAALLSAAVSFSVSGNSSSGEPEAAAESQEETNMGEAVNVKEEYEGSISRVSVHDPSIIKEQNTGTYYVFGSHLASAKSDDLVNWEQICKDYEDVSDNPIYGNLQENFAESFRWAGFNDGDCVGGYAVWAPDVYWDDKYIWEDGSQGAYLMYYSASSSWKRSCIGLAVSKEIEGPYTYAATMIYSGFSREGGVDENSQIDTKWDNDYLNLKELTALGSENGGIDEVSEEWFSADGTYNHKYAPNAIDPTAVEDAEGNLYLVYGSWSGGLFILEVDEETGLVIYPGVDSTDEESGNFTDRYYGTHIAGGKHQSGEGPFILYDEEAGYYYLYETYGSLTADGGYNMRMFRSENIYGPYVDAAGNNAADSGKVENSKYGVKLMGNYQFDGQRGYKSAGHNSALIDGDGQRYLIFHQRFNEGSEYHEVRVRQQYLNEDGWPCTAVYENRNEAIANVEDAAVAGTYEYINHGKENSPNMLETGTLELKEDGSVSGAFEGTWSKADSGKGYDYVTVAMDTGLEFKGIFYEQTDDTGEKVMTFSAIGSNNTCIWGSMVK